MLSRYLPPDFDASRPIALIAGRGHYPERTAQKIREAGIPLRLIHFEGETRDALVERFSESERASIKVGQVGKMLKALKRLGAGYALMAGQVQPKRLFNSLHPDLKAIRILASLKVKNAETIFVALAREIESVGIRMLDARALLDEDMATPGVMVKGKEKVDPDTLEHGIKVVKEIAALDVGQGLVARKGTILAVEAFEGTDPMLRRAGTFKTDKMVFIKTAKPNQNFCFDVPIFGLRTLETLCDAGVRTAALESETTIILEKAAVLAEAKRLGITLLGYTHL